MSGLGSLFGGSSSSTNAPQTGASDAAKILSGKEATYAESGAVQVGKGGSLKVIEAGAVDLSGAGNKSIQSGGVAVSGTGPVTVTTADKDVALAAIASANDLSDKFGGSLSDYVAKSSAANAASQTETLKAIADLAGQKEQNTSDAAVAATDSTATGGVSVFKSTILWLGLGLLVVVGIALSKKRA